MRTQLIEETIRDFPADGTLPPNRLVRLSSGVLALAGATSADVLGATVGGVGIDAPNGSVAMRSSSSSYLVEANGAVTEGIVYQAADGKIASSGTVEAGVALEGGTDVAVEIMPL